MMTNYTWNLFKYYHIYRYYIYIIIITPNTHLYFLKGSVSLTLTNINDTISKIFLFHEISQINLLNLKTHSSK